MSVNTDPRPNPPLLRSGARTFAELIPLAAERFGDRAALARKCDDEWVDVTFAEVGIIVGEIAQGLRDLGLARGEPVALLCNTRPEWSYLDFAISTAGCVVVPIYPTNAAEECEYVLTHSQSKAVVCENAEQLAKIAEVRDRLPALEHVVVIDPQDADDGAISLDALRERGRPVDLAAIREHAASVSGNETFTIIYTSGTTGPPKGCVLSHHNYRSSLDAVHELEAFRSDDVLYLFLPLAHAMARFLQLASFDLGAKLVYFGGDPAKIVTELHEVKPTYFPSVPRMFEKIYAMTASSIEDEVGRDRLEEFLEVANEARKLDYAGRPVPDDLQRRWEDIDAQAFARVRDAFGGRIRQAGTGAAPIERAVLEFFYAAGVPVLEGYGMTETATAISMSTPAQYRFGTVGRPLPGVDVKIADDGEILVNGDNVFEGYYQDEEATAEALVDDWLHTGDLGSLDEDGFLSISGRKKDIIITAGGKNLTPANLENEVKKCRFVSQAVMYGDRRPFPTMLVTLDAQEIGAWASERDKPDHIAALAEDPDVVALVQEVLDAANAKQAPPARVKRFFILDRDLSPERDELTPTMKVKRNVVHERYVDRFDALY